MEEGEVVLCTWGHNEVTGKPFQFLYEFGYYTNYGCVVYNKGERNMQDSHAFQLTQVRPATKKDLKEYFYGS